MVLEISFTELGLDEEGENDWNTIRLHGHSSENKIGEIQDKLLGKGSEKEECGVTSSHQVKVLLIRILEEYENTIQNH